MVDRTQLDQVNELYGEQATITRALSVFDAGGRIVELTVATPADSVMVSSEYMSYPGPMIASIRQQLEQRQVVIRQELTNLGITGMM